MNAGLGGRKDLCILVADRSMAAAVEGLLRRSTALRICAVEYDVLSHPQNDPGCYRKCELMLRPFIEQYSFALVMFDRHGCGHEQLTRDELEREVEERLAMNGWPNRAKAVVIDPELEVWIWSDSPHVDDALGWSGRVPVLRAWLESKNYVAAGQAKPRKPQAVFKHALREAHKPLSASIFRQLADRVSVDRCTDPAFGKLKAVLRAWFPANNPEFPSAGGCADGTLFGAGGLEPRTAPSSDARANSRPAGDAHPILESCPEAFDSGPELAESGV
jgi:hypothetical protein